MGITGLSAWPGFKYRPTFPRRFGSAEDARAHCQEFFEWYNRHHRHAGIGIEIPSRRPMPTTRNGS